MSCCDTIHAPLPRRPSAQSVRAGCYRTRWTSVVTSSLTMSSRPWRTRLCRLRSRRHRHHSLPLKVHAQLKHRSSVSGLCYVMIGVPVFLSSALVKMDCRLDGHNSACLQRACFVVEVNRPAVCIHVGGGGTMLIMYLDVASQTPQAC